MIPSCTDELTPEWFTEALGEPVDGVEILDAHSGTTGRARSGLRASSAVPATVFVKLQPFAAEQRKFLRQIGLGVAEARLHVIGFQPEPHLLQRLDDVHLHRADARLLGGRGELAAALSQIMESTVTSVSLIGGDAGTSSRARLALTGDGVPQSVFVKMAAQTAATRLMGEIGILGETETRFYRELAPEVSGVPKSYGSAFDRMLGRYVLVLEDLAVELTQPLLKISLRRLANRSDVPVEEGRVIAENYGAVALLIDRQVLAGAGRPGTGSRRPVGPVLQGCAVRLRRVTDHRRNGRHAGRGHCAGGTEAKRSRARGPRHGRSVGEGAVIEALPSLRQRLRP